MAVGSRVRALAASLALGLACSREAAPIEAGPSPLRRLNRTEYDHTVRDLLGTTRTPADDFPPDDSSQGFDDVAASLPLSPVLFELYERAADALVTEALAPTTPSGAFNPARGRILVCDLTSGGDACAREILGAFAARAWRRPVTSGELDRLMGLALLARDQGDTEEAGVALALRAALVHPAFVYRVELDPPGTVPLGGPHPLGAYELASRLSYFLWSSMPDDGLLAAAASGGLESDAGLARAVDRMLDDPRAASLVHDFAAQWLETRDLAGHQVDYGLFPDYDAELSRSMDAEASAFLGELFASETLPVSTLLTADFAWVNDRLATHYGLPLPGSDDVVRVHVDPTARGGLLRLGAFLTVTSNPDRTSPVRRGRFVLERLLCDAPPDPPANIPPVTKQELEGKTTREVFEAHRADPACASCHDVMDPLGFGLERYDAVGAYRETERDLPVDASGVLPSGEAFSGAADMARLVAEDPRFPRCVVSKLFTFALGRAPDAADAPAIDAITSGFLEDGGTLRAAIRRLVASAPFRMRRREIEGEGAP